MMTPGHDRKGNRWQDTTAPRQSFILYVCVYVCVYIYIYIYIYMPGESMDKGAWWATVHGITKSWTRLSD